MSLPIAHPEPLQQRGRQHNKECDQSPAGVQERRPPPQTVRGKNREEQSISHTGKPHQLVCCEDMGKRKEKALPEEGMAGLSARARAGELQVGCHIRITGEEASCPLIIQNGSPCLACLEIGVAKIEIYIAAGEAGLKHRFVCLDRLGVLPLGVEAIGAEKSGLRRRWSCQGNRSRPENTDTAEQRKSQASQVPQVPQSVKLGQSHDPVVLRGKSVKLTMIVFKPVNNMTDEGHGLVTFFSH